LRQKKKSHHPSIIKEVHIYEQKVQKETSMYTKKREAKHQKENLNQKEDLNQKEAQEENK